MTAQRSQAGEAVRALFILVLGQKRGHLAYDFIRRHLRLPQLANDLGLTRFRHGAIAHQRRHHMVVAQILAPRLKLLRRIAYSFTELRQRLSEAVGIEVGQAGRGKRVAKNLPYRGGARPMFIGKTLGFELQLGADDNLSLRKKRVVISEQLLAGEIGYPVTKDFVGIATNGEKPAREALAEFGLHVAGVLTDAALDKIYMLQFERSNGAVPRAGQNRQGYDGTISSIDLGFRRHHGENMQDLLKGWETPFVTGFGYPQILLRERKIISVGIAES